MAESRYTQSQEERLLQIRERNKLKVIAFLCCNFPDHDFQAVAPSRATAVWLVFAGFNISGRDSGPQTSSTCLLILCHLERVAAPWKLSGEGQQKCWLCGRKKRVLQGGRRGHKGWKKKNTDKQKERKQNVRLNTSVPLWTSCKTSETWKRMAMSRSSMKVNLILLGRISWTSSNVIMRVNLARAKCHPGGPTITRARSREPSLSAESRWLSENNHWCFR